MYDMPEFADRDMTAVSGSGSIYSTAADVIAWMDAFRTGHVISPASVALALTPNLGNYGFGWTIFQLHNTQLHWHNGALQPVGFTSEMGFTQSTGFAYALLTNVNSLNLDKGAVDIVRQYLVEQCPL